MIIFLPAITILYLNFLSKLFRKAEKFLTSSIFPIEVKSPACIKMSPSGISLVILSIFECVSDINTNLILFLKMK